MLLCVSYAIILVANVITIVTKIIANDKSKKTFFLVLYVMTIVHDIVF